MPLGTLSHMSLFVIFALTTACSSGTDLKASNQKKQTSAEAKPENKKIVSEDTDEKQKGSEDDDDDLTVIPPEVVSAAYLTCSTSDTDTSPEEGEVHLGCNITKKDGQRLEVNSEKSTWDLKGKNGKNIAYKNIDVSESSKYQKLFSLAKSDYDQGVTPSVAVEVSDGKTILVKRKGVVKINGKEID